MSLWVRIPPALLERRIFNGIIDRAIKEARKSPHLKFKHGAIIVKGGKIIAAGYNHFFFHAEAVALSKVPPSVRVGCSIVTVRVSKGTFKLTNGYPCSSCRKMMKRMGVKSFTFSQDGSIHKEIV